MLIEYKNVNIYQQDNLILKDVNFHADEGEFIYLIGKVGAGKTTLLKTLYMELEINEADEATILERDLTTLKRKQIPALRRQMGIIFQDFQLLGDRSVRRNLRFVLRATGWTDKQKINKRIKDVLQKVGMEEKASKMPHELSGGEQQRVAIARAILNNPKIIVADEPTGNLDPETAEDVVRLLRDIAQTGTAVIMSTHNLPMLDKYSGRVYRCKDGTLEELTTEDYKQDIYDN